MARKKASTQKRRPKSKSPTTSVSTDSKIDSSSVRLVQGKGSKGTGGAAGGHFWHIYCDEARAGRVFINLIDEEPFGEHASIQIYLNQKSQGKGIGRIAYRLACEQSDYDEVYAHMRKSNVASKKAALAAGFEVVEHEQVSQLAMRWKRTNSA